LKGVEAKNLLGKKILELMRFNTTAPSPNTTPTPLTTTVTTNSTGTTIPPSPTNLNFFNHNFKNKFYQCCFTAFSRSDPPIPVNF
jgi:hypothetical protein